MLTIEQFMGGGEGKSPAADFYMSYGNGRCNVYRPSTGNIVANLPHPDLDFLHQGAAHFYVVNAAAVGKNLLIKDPKTGTTIADVDGGKCAVVSLGDADTWFATILSRIT